MKQLIKIVGFMAFGAVSAGDSVYLNSEEMLNLEVNAPVGFEINHKGEIIGDGTQAMIDLDRPIGGTSIRYYSSAAAAMQNISSNGYKYSSPGCRQSTISSTEMDDAIDLPSGTKIVSFSAYGIDNSNSSSANALLYQKNMNTGAFNIKESYSSGTNATPNRFSIGGFLDFTLTINDSLLVRLNGLAPDITLCGYRIGYVPPGVASDVIFVNNFYR